MKQVSAGLLMYRIKEKIEFFLVHPGGPFFSKRNEGAWTIPKGIIEQNEELLAAAIREFTEETGLIASEPFIELGSIKQKNGKVVHAWAFEGEWENDIGIKCNTFTIEWPPRSGKSASFPEVDKANWFSFNEATVMIIQEQKPFIERCTERTSTEQ